MTSVAISVTVNAAEAKLYYIHCRSSQYPKTRCGDQQRNGVEMDQQEPFGVNAPDENPSGLASFELPLRHSGQYMTKETTLQYSIRITGTHEPRKIWESDPCRLKDGSIPMRYVGGTPLTRTDPLGLAYFGYRFASRYAFGVHCWLVWHWARTTWRTNQLFF